MNTNRIILLAIVAIVIVALGVTNFRADSKPQNGACKVGVASETKVVLPKFVELFAEWCGPCRQMKPIVAGLEKEYQGKVQFEKIDIDKNPDVTKKYNVSAIPVQIFFGKDGKQVFKHVGFLSKDEIVAQLKKMGVK